MNRWRGAIALVIVGCGSSREVLRTAPAPAPATIDSSPQPTATLSARLAPSASGPVLPPSATASAPVPLSPVVASQGSCPSGMLEIPGGTFQMGGEGAASEKPVHTVTLDSYCLDVTEVTVDDYAKCVRVGRCSKPGTDELCNWGIAGKGNHPINCVDWQQAASYCGYAGKALPSEAQWEYAARGGARQQEYPWGNEAPNDGNACWNRMSSKQGTCVVGSKPAGAFGLRDMAGNVSEWVADWHELYPSTVSANYRGPSSGSRRVFRGGGWSSDNVSFFRGASRHQFLPGERGMSLGFRCGVR